MGNYNLDIFKTRDVTGNIVPVHKDCVIGIHEHFSDGEKFISVSKDGTMAVIETETLEIENIKQISKYSLVSSALFKAANEKLLITGDVQGNLFLINEQLQIKLFPLNFKREISAIADIGNQEIVIAVGDNQSGSCFIYLSIGQEKIFNKVPLQIGRKIKDIQHLAGVKDQAIVSCSMSNIYWLKVIDHQLKLLIDEPSPDQFYYDQVWSNGKEIIKAGQSSLFSQKCPVAIRKVIEELQDNNITKYNSLFVHSRAVIRGELGSLYIIARDGEVIRTIRFPKGRFPIELNMSQFGCIQVGFQTGDVGRLDFRCPSLRFLMS